MDYKALLDKISEKAIKLAKRVGTDFFPYNDVDGKYGLPPFPNYWTAGYYPGLLWLAYENTKDEFLKETAVKLEEKMDEWIYDYNVPDHDVGFVWLLSSGIHNKNEKNPDSKRRLLRMANYLAGRFNINSRTIRAWPSPDHDDYVPTFAIIDCMMNIPLLFTASNTIGDPRYAHVARAHADTVMKHFIDEDGAVRHVCRFNMETGEFIESIGGQGYGPKSSWSRGAAWAIYGFAMAYRYTGKREYLETAKKVSKFFISQIQDDYLPAWDFRAPNKEIKDSSAAAVAASGMLEIFAHTKDAYFKCEAEKLIESLSQNCLADDSYESILKRGTGNLPTGDSIEVGLIYGDYYFAEAVAKLAYENYSLPWEKSF